MADEKDEKRGDEAAPAGGAEPEAEGAGEGEGGEGEAGEGEAGEGGGQRPRISLERYMGSRRRTMISWAHLAALVFMLVALVVLLMYKDRCGEAASKLIFMGTPDSGTRPNVRIQLEEPGRGSGAPSKAPASQPGR